MEWQHHLKLARCLEDKDKQLLNEQEALKFKRKACMSTQTLDWRYLVVAGEASAVDSSASSSSSLCWCACRRVLGT
jgi:hypothetical protein